MITIEDIRREQYEREVIKNVMIHVNSEVAKNAIRLADELFYMILFHVKVRENAKDFLTTWDW